MLVAISENPCNPFNGNVIGHTIFLFVFFVFYILFFMFYFSIFFMFLCFFFQIPQCTLACDFNCVHFSDLLQQKNNPSKTFHFAVKKKTNTKHIFFVTHILTNKTPSNT